MSKPTPYALNFDQISDLCDAVCELDGMAGYCIDTEKDRIKALVAACHEHIQTALGEHVEWVYGKDPEAA